MFFTRCFLDILLNFNRYEIHTILRKIYKIYSQHFEKSFHSNLFKIEISNISYEPNILERHFRDNIILYYENKFCTKSIRVSIHVYRYHTHITKHWSAISVLGASILDSPKHSRSTVIIYLKELAQLEVFYHINKHRTTLSKSWHRVQQRGGRFYRGNYRRAETEFKTGSRSIRNVAFKADTAFCCAFRESSIQNIYIYIYMYLEHARISTRFCSIRCTPTPSSFLIPRIHMDIKRSCSAINPPVHRVHQHYEFVLFCRIRALFIVIVRSSTKDSEIAANCICINALTIGDVLLVISRNIQGVTKFDCIVAYLWVN